ncbi:cyclohexanecarboxylate-CoA ligase [Mycobacterium sp. PS03-16]|uniref:AMP-binding protein n=1 Tax=Mycobacterium sp. PS03-16 TaxID=2559611 RepID=UPI001073A69B|nr:AMP-binding protein [Mycobacterium sp. PS03-16]TFV57087.1 cyclohexanecarboxylate-CoA ligase [Mycobacterium sp. PS03-16]
MAIAVRTVGDPERCATYLERGWWRADRTYGDDFREWAARRPGHIAVVAHEVDTGQTVTVSYGELAERVSRCVAGLRARGVTAGSVVSFQLPNCWQFAVLVFACARLGAVVHPILPIHREREVTHAIRAVDSSLCVVASRIGGFELRAMYDVMGLEVPVITVGRAGDPCGFESELMSDGVAGDHYVSPASVAQVQFTSGTTGEPKGVVHTFNTLFAAYRATAIAAELDSDDVVLAPSTMAHQTAFLGGCVMPLAEGMTAVYLDKWDPDSALRLIGDHGVTFASGATPFMIDLCNAQQRLHLDVTSLRAFKSGGAAVPDAVRARVRAELGAEVSMAWGMTENGVCTMTRPGGGNDQADGSALPWVELKITDTEGRPQPAGTVGKLWIRSASQCVDYFPRHDLYEAALDAEGWFDTGDLAELRADGNLRIAGRVKDMIIRGGENIPVLEVENALSAHPAVADVAVVGIPDERLGERACAVVVPATGREFGIEALRRHLDTLGMARQYWPESVRLVKALPRTTTGKVQKNELREAIVKVK